MRLRPRLRAYSAPPDSLAGFKGEGKGKGGEGGEVGEGQGRRVGEVDSNVQLEQGLRICSETRNNL